MAKKFSNIPRKKNMKTIRGDRAMAKLRQLGTERPSLSDSTTMVMTGHIRFIDSNGKKVSTSRESGGVGVISTDYAPNGVPATRYLIDRDHVHELDAVEQKFCHAMYENKREWPDELAGLDNRNLMAIGAFIIGMITGMWLATKEVP